MLLFPAIDLYEGKAVRLFKGDYAQMTIYSDNPVEVAKGFKAAGANYLHVVDLEGAKTGDTPNYEVIANIVKESGLNVEVGGGIRSLDVVRKYIDAGVLRIILGTAAITQPDFLEEAVRLYGEKVAVGVDMKDGKVAIKGWTEVSEYSCNDFCEKLAGIGVKTIICTDISKDGVLGGTNLALYKELSEKFPMDIIASGGVSSLDDVAKLNEMDMYGAILGKALYTGNIDLNEAIALVRK